MSTSQNTTQIPDTEAGLGPIKSFSTSGQAMLTEMFPSPLNGADDTYDPAAVKEIFLKKVMRGTVDDAYWGFGESSEFNRDYEGYGDLTPPAYDFKYETEKRAGDPINSFVPNLMSAPMADPKKQIPPGTKMTEWANDDAQKGSAPFWGLGTGDSPATTSANLVEAPQGWTSVTGDDMLLGNYLNGTSNMIVKPEP